MAELKAIAGLIVEQLAGANGPERSSLATRLESQLRGLFEIGNAPKALLQRLADPLAEGESLSDWCRNRVAAGSFAEDAFAPLLTLAELLDFLATTSEPLLVLVPRWFRITEEARLAAPRPLLALGTVDRKLARLSDSQRKDYGGLMHPGLLRSLAGFDAGSAIVYSLALFLMDVFLGIQASTRAEIQDALAKCRLRDNTVPPQVPVFFHKLMANTADKPPICSCRQAVAAVLAAYRESPFLCQPALDISVRHEYFGYSVPGLHKKGNSNEDRFVGRTTEEATWVLVADGISTADLGSGEIAAEEIVRLVSRKYASRFEELTSSLSSGKVATWPGNGDRFLAKFFRDANQSVVAMDNELRAERADGSVPASPMASTLVSAVVLHDQAVIRHLGDSAAWLFCPSQKALYRLNSEHNVGGEGSFSFESDKQETALTRVIGACHFSREQDAFVADEQEAEVLHVQLRPGDLLLLTSDGLVDGIDQPTEEAKVELLETELQRLAAAGTPLPRLVRQLVALAEDGLSNDNITLVAVRITTEVRSHV